MTDVLTYSDNPQLASELTTAASALVGTSGKAYAIEVDAVREGAARGPTLLIRSERPVSGDYELTASAIAEAARTKGSQVVLIGSTKVGRMVAARLSVIDNMCVLGDVRELRMDEDGVAGVKGVYAGKFNARVQSPLPCVALVPQGAYESAAWSAGHVEELALSAPASRTRRVGTKASQKSSLDLRGAKVIVAAGRGFRNKEDLALAEKLARALGGSLGASRPLSSDLGWLGEEYHIGLTGVYVRPDLYLAIGISGQLQHVAGIKDSKVIAAINKDKQAPIFQVADYGIVGDLYQVVPELLKLLGAE